MSKENTPNTHDLWIAEELPSIDRVRNNPATYHCPRIFSIIEDIWKLDGYRYPTVTLLVLEGYMTHPDAKEIYYVSSGRFQMEYDPETGVYGTIPKGYDNLSLPSAKNRYCSDCVGTDFLDKDIKIRTIMDDIEHQKREAMEMFDYEEWLPEDAPERMVYAQKKYGELVKLERDYKDYVERMLEDLEIARELTKKPFHIREEKTLSYEEQRERNRQRTERRYAHTEAVRIGNQKEMEQIRKSLGLQPEDNLPKECDEIPPVWIMYQGKPIPGFTPGKYYKVISQTRYHPIVKVIDDHNNGRLIIPENKDGISSMTERVWKRYTTHPILEFFTPLGAWGTEIDPRLLVSEEASICLNYPRHTSLVSDYQHQR